MIDLHIHTTFSSDGIYRPETILKKAVEKGLKALSFTDHNEILANYIGLKKAKNFNLKYIIGTEITSYYKKRELHILGYFFSIDSQIIKDLLKNIRNEKLMQAKKICKKLQNLGFEIYLEDVLKFSKRKPPTGVSFLKAILKNNKNLKDERLIPYIKGGKKRSPFMHFYNDWLTPNKPAYVPGKEITTEEAIYSIIKSNGLAVIAHPQNLSEADIEELIRMGLNGIEVYTTYHDEKKRLFYKTIAEKRGLIMTAGSDYHGERIKKDVHLGEIGENDIVLLERMEEYYKKYYGKNPYSM
ncbi:MAG: PHP domain-containing protein [Proteobacteria bacterium]|nr:PHP domain-containing protein [Pseudomonadota bacterium]